MISIILLAVLLIAILYKGQKTGYSNLLLGEGGGTKIQDWVL
jgi:hypothetical protein